MLMAAEVLFVKGVQLHIKTSFFRKGVSDKQFSFSQNKVDLNV